MVFIDLTGKTFGDGKLMVLRREQNDKNGKVRWLCQCSCGNQKIIYGSNLRSGKTTSCGCVQKERITKHNAQKNEDMFNQKFGELTVIARAGIKSNGQQLWLCKCTCGGKKEFTTSVLKRGEAISCGCEKRKIMLKANSKLNATRVDNVIIPSLQKRVSKNNSTGHKGVHLRKTTGRYEAYISVNNKRIQLGSYENLEAAIQARKNGDEKYHKPYIDKFEEEN